MEKHIILGEEDFPLLPFFMRKFLENRIERIKMKRRTVMETILGEKDFVLFSLFNAKIFGE